MNHDSVSRSSRRKKNYDSPAVGAVGVSMVALAALTVGVRADSVDGDDGLLYRRRSESAGSVRWKTETYSEHFVIYEVVRLRGFDCEGL